jgi:hypothetical protein
MQGHAQYDENNRAVGSLSVLAHQLQRFYALTERLLKHLMQKSSTNRR